MKAKKINKSSESPSIVIIKWVFLGILALIPFHGILSTWAFTNLGHELVFKSWKEILLLVVIVIAAYVLIKNPKMSRKLLGRVINKLIIAYVMLHLVWALFAQVAPEAMWQALAINLRFLAFFVLAQILVEVTADKKFRQLALRVVLIVATVVAILSLLQLILPRELLEWFGYSKETIPAYFTIDRNLDFVRYASTTRGPNPLGAYLIVPITIALAYLLKRFDWKRVTQIAVMTGAMYLTYSRSAWLGLVGSLATFTLFFSPSKIKRFSRVALPIMIVILVLAVGMFKSSDYVQNAVIHQDPGEGGLVDSTGEHWTATKAGLEDIAKNPLGSGPGTVGPASFKNDGQAKISENYFVQIGQEVGVLGLALFLAINVLLAKELFIGGRKSGIKGALFASLIGLSIVSLFLHGWADEEVAYTFWGLAGLYAYRV